MKNEILLKDNKIKKELLEKGYEFVGQTDTEILCGLIDNLYKDEKDIVKVNNNYKGIIGIFIIFLLILFIKYPADSIKSAKING